MADMTAKEERKIPENRKFFPRVIMNVRVNDFFNKENVPTTNAFYVKMRFILDLDLCFKSCIVNVTVH